MKAGASALSVLTDEKYFGGSNRDLMTARKFNFCPILRKEFIVDEYQVIETRSIGADAILLIAAILTPGRTEQLGGLAMSLGLEVLLEVHNEGEINTHLTNSGFLAGINNRDLTSFKVDVSTSLELGKKLPSDVIRISESGLHDPATIMELKSHGFHGFLIGEYFMTDSRPERACRDFINEIGRLEKKAGSYGKAEA
jgi:indole-3-glycerol phosphate synthase